MRCFVAVWPNADVVEALAALPRPAIDGLRWSGQDQWHVTLRFFGELDPGDVGLATEAVGLAAQGLDQPIVVHGGPGTRFLGPGLVIWPVEGLRPAAEAVERVSAHIGQPLPGRQFFGHLTIARGRRGADLRRERHILVAAFLFLAGDLGVARTKPAAPRRCSLPDFGKYPYRASLSRPGRRRSTRQMDLVK